MDKPKKPNKYPAFRWSPERKARLQQLYQEGKTLEDIAAALETNTETVLKAVQKLNICRSMVVHPPVGRAQEPVVSASEPPPAVQEAQAQPDQEVLHRLQDLLKDASRLHSKATRMFFDEERNSAFYTMGTLEQVLKDAHETISTLLAPQEP